MQPLKPYLPFLVLAVISFSLIYWLFPVIHPYAGMHLPLSADSIVARSKSMLRDLGIDGSGMSHQIELKGDRPLLHDVQQRFGLERSNELLRKGIPGYYWEVRWRTEDSRGVSFRSGGGNSKNVEAVAEFLKGDVYFRFDGRGRLLQFEHKLPDSAKIPTVSESRAKLLAFGFLTTYAGERPSVVDTGGITSERSTVQPNRVDHEFTWTSKREVLDNPLSIKVTIAGNQLSKFVAEDEFPKRADSFDPQQIYYVVLVLFSIACAIVMIVVAFRRFRSYEIGFRLAVVMGITTGLLYDVTSYLEARGEAGWLLLMTLFFVPLFVGGALALVWAVGESVVRETWKDKFIAFDLMSKGYFLHERVGGNVLRGIAGGFGALALWLVLVSFGDRTLHFWISTTDDLTYRTFELSSPVPYILAHSYNLVIFIFAIFVVFLVSILRRNVRSTWLLVSLSALMIGFLNSGHLAPLPAGIVIQAAVSAVFVWLFCRFDALASLVSLVTYGVLQETAGLFVAGSPLYASSGFVMPWLFGGVVVVSLIALYRKNQITDFDDIVPAFVRHITERQRLQQELEIARSVQMSFLPKSNPATSRLDIASRCAPALEVGGDYYDFIDLGNKKLGVAIGDVSGKGTQAAFFMTLTKGFLNALAHVSDSPSKILTQVNRLFYESVERGMFISMVYGIFDTKKNLLTLARAGHNPVIMRKSKAHDVQVVNPMGLALGLDQGKTFAKSIEEISVKFQSGDLFVFYTDGFPEAVNKSMEEFGEERLCRTVERCAGGSAAEIMDGVFKEMRQFTGKAQQHDDMTIVVVKVV